MLLIKSVPKLGHALKRRIVKLRIAIYVFSLRFLRFFKFLSYNCNSLVHALFSKLPRYWGKILRFVNLIFLVGVTSKAEFLCKRSVIIILVCSQEEHQTDSLSQLFTPKQNQ